MQRRLLTVISDASACPAPPQGADHRLRVVVHATDRSGCWLSKRSSVDPVRSCTCTSLKPNFAAKRNRPLSAKHLLETG
jgi:hypothetical protein